MNPAESYEQYFVPAMFRPWAKRLLGRALPQPAERVLDVACGTGIVAREVAPIVGASGLVSGVDMNPAMLAVARSIPAPAGATIQWQPGNAQDLPFANDAFDLALCQHGLQFFPDRVAALREMYRVIAPGGRVAVTVLQPLALHPVFSAVMQSVASHLELPVTSVAAPFVLGDADELRSLFVAAGFANITIDGESIVAHFPAKSFVPRAVVSSAAAIPAFNRLDESEREALIAVVRAEVQPQLEERANGDSLAVPMFAHVAQGRKQQA